MVITVLFVFSNFYGLFIFKLKEVQAGGGVVSAPFLELIQSGWSVSDAANITLDKTLSQINSVLYKNILGGMLNTMAAETATWVATGFKGEAPLFISNWEAFAKDYYQAALAQMVYNIVKNLTGLNVCDLDPKLAFQLVVKNPVYESGGGGGGGGSGYGEDQVPCSWTDLEDKFSKFEDIFKDMSFDLTNKGVTGGGIERLGEQIKTDTTLQTTVSLLMEESLIAGATAASCEVIGDYPAIQGVPSAKYKIMRCSMAKPEAQTKLVEFYDELSALTTKIQTDIDFTVAQRKAGGEIGAPEAQKIRDKYLEEVDLENSIPIRQKKVKEMLDEFSKCSGAPINAFYEGGQCNTILSRSPGFLMERPMPECDVKQGSAEEKVKCGTLKYVYMQEVTKKVKYVNDILKAMDSAYNSLKKAVNNTFQPENWQEEAAYNYEQGTDALSSKKPTEIFSDISKLLTGEGYQADVTSRTELLGGSGFKGPEETVTKDKEAPPAVVEAKTTQDIVEQQGKQAFEYTKDIVADALGVFMSTLWNQLTLELLMNLLSGGEKESKQKLGAISAKEEAKEEIIPVAVYSPYEQQINTAEGFASFAAKTMEKFSAKFAAGADLNLLADFQINVKGKVNPNIYNNVIDQNFAVAVSDKMTIKQALDQGKIIGTNSFAWGTELEEGKYHLSNLKKLRKARVVPLGLELAVELIRDCTYRKEQNLDDFSDIDFESGRPTGFNEVDYPLKTQKLQNCVFRTAKNAEEVIAVRAYNSRKLNEVIAASFNDVVNGFATAGSGICGDFDDNESPFCNLVDPNWVLKIPPTRCGLQSDKELYGEILQSNESGSRYSRCPDFASCLLEDGKGGCIEEQYGYCVKEKNYWQFGAAYCPEEYNSCRTYTLNTNSGNLSVAYLKNTLSGSDVCGPDNAGCNWYATTFTDGRWQTNNRLYLNRNAETCDASNDGCSELYLWRDPGNNLVADSSFEYMTEGNFPANWDLYLRSELTTPEAEAACVSPQKKYASCVNYDYGALLLENIAVREILCKENGGIWYNGCLTGDTVDTNIFDAAACSSAGGRWGYCVNAIKLLDLDNLAAEKDDCLNNGEAAKIYCLTNILKYNLCSEPQFTDIPAGLTAQEQCENNGGSWKTECLTDTGPVAELNTPAVCETNYGSWHEFCQGARIYNSNALKCLEMKGQWQGYGPFSSIAKVSKDNANTYDGSAKLEIDISSLSATEQLQLVYSTKYNDPNKALTKAGDVYSATAYLKANKFLNNKSVFNLVKTDPEEISSTYTNLYDGYYQLTSTLVTANSGNQLQILITLPGGEGADTKVYIDAVDLYLNSQEQIINSSYIRQPVNYNNNNKVYFKKPPEYLNCHGYGPGDPAPLIRDIDNQAVCQSAQGFWDESGVYTGQTGVCYKYAPDNARCSSFLKVCEAEEVGCQLYTPVNGDPAVPGVITTNDFCPAECVGYNTYTQEAALYDPVPDPLYNFFIPDTATSCLLDQVGCTQFTQLQITSPEGQVVQPEQVRHFTYLRQCIKPNLGLKEKTFFTWRGSAAGAPQLVKYEFQADEEGAPKLIDHLIYEIKNPIYKDCRYTLGEQDLNCVKFYDSDGKIFYRDLTKTISVSNNCYPFRKTSSANGDAKKLAVEEDNCDKTNGAWDLDNNECNYNAIPEEAVECPAEVNGCRAYVGNRGNNLYVKIFDSFEDTGDLDWFTSSVGTESQGLTKVGESVAVGGHSLLVSQGVTAIHKFTNLQSGKLYTLSFWAKTENPAGNILAASFANDSGIAEETFATLENRKISLTNEWKNFNLGPVYVTRSGLTDNSILFEGFNSKVYIDNITLRVVRDNVYKVKNSWTTPVSCDRNIYGAVEPLNDHPMLGCQVYVDLLNQTYNLKSFTSLCRENAVGCQVVIDTHNSANANEQMFNADNESLLDNHTVPKDELMTLVLNTDLSCPASAKGCQRVGQIFNEGLIDQSSLDLYFENDPERYVNVPKAILCDEDSLGCNELVNQLGSYEYYKIESGKLCYYGINDIAIGNISLPVQGWFRKGGQKIGCGSLEPLAVASLSLDACLEKGGRYSSTFGQCVLVLNDITDPTICGVQRGEWVNDECLAWPFSIYKIEEANKYKGNVGECDASYAGCNEFRDINPNYIFNGSFETITETNSVLSWQSTNTASGSREIDAANAKTANQSLKLIKLTDADCPITATSVNPALCDAAPYVFTQKVGRLEKGKTFKISFYYMMPADSKGVGENCPLPTAALEFNSLSAGVPGSPLFVYQAEKDWKKAEILYTVPFADAYPDLQDFELNLFAPLNGHCILGGKKVYEEDTVMFLNKNQCLSRGGTWTGNCPESYVLYDQVEVKENTEDSYYVIDSGNSIDRKSCTAVDWENGCVQFQNTVNKTLELIKVKNDRNCEEWAMCDSYCSNPEYKTADNCKKNGFIWNTNVCTATNLCTESLGNSDNCVRYSTKMDNVRYALNKEPLEVSRVANVEKRQGYIYRFGTSALSRLVQWRAGDYSGYSLPYRIPVESELALEQSDRFKNYEQINDLDDMRIIDGRYSLPVCKAFPAEDSPLPFAMSAHPDFKNLLNLYAENYGVNTLGNLCSYEKITALTQRTYVPILGTKAVEGICTSPASKKGKPCDTDENCTDPKIKRSAGSCEVIEESKDFYGLENMCLEFDVLNPLYGDVYKNLYNTGIYQPYACLTYMPFGIDLCPLHTNQSNCLSNSNCKWDSASNICSLDLARIVPVVTEMEPIAAKIADQTPEYKFFSTEAGVITYEGVCYGSTTNAIAGNNTITLGARVEEIDAQGTVISISSSPLNPGVYNNCSITVTDTGGQVSEPLDITPFEVVYLQEITPVPAITINNINPSYTFASIEAGPITCGIAPVYPDPLQCGCAPKEAVIGNNTIIFKKVIPRHTIPNETYDYVSLDPGIYNNCTVSVNGHSLNVSQFIIHILTEVATVDPANNALYKFNSPAAGKIYYAAGCASSSPQAISGINEINFNVGPGTYNSCTIVVEAAGGIRSPILNVTPFTIPATP